MQIFFAVDSGQARPSRPGMGPLLSVGGLLIPSNQLHTLEHELNDICTSAGFPRGEEFKWSPSRTHWMRRALTMDARFAFFEAILSAIKKCGGKALVVVTDTRRTPRRYDSPEMFVTILLFERIGTYLSSQNSKCLMIFDRPAGARSEENKFLARIIDDIQSHADIVKLNTFTINPVSSDSKHVRCLQAADLVTACATAVIAGQTTHTRGPWEIIKSVLISDLSGRKGGVGCKIFGDQCEYHNLYHWLLGDDVFGPELDMPLLPIPHREWHYFRDANTRLPR